jgi:hypothetical protein
VKIGDGNVCPSCNETPVTEQVVQCRVCKCNFHAVCESAGNDCRQGSNTMVKTFNATSTKSNFMWFCDICLTNYERSIVETENDKLTALNTKVVSMEAKLENITKILQGGSASASETQSVPKQVKYNKRTCWDDAEKLSTIKAPKSKPQVVIKKSNEENQNKIEEALIQNKVQVHQSFKNKDGDLVVVCESDQECEVVKNLVTTTSENTEIRTPNEKRPSITIVGLPKEYKKEEILQLLVLQNGFIKGFANQNDITEHIEIYAVRPLKKDESTFQAFASVSPTLREGIKYFKDRLTIGFANCKVYDRYHVKRCYNCQLFGHYAKDCPTADEHVCGKCNGTHKTNDCDGALPQCANCVRDNAEDTSHHAFDTKCPALKKNQDVEKKKLESNRLNYSIINLYPT